MTTKGQKIMNVTVEDVFPSEAHARLLSNWNKQFSKEYEGNTKSQGLSSKERIATGLKDIKDGVAFFIKVDGKKVGMVISPWITDEDGNILSRFLDTRWIEPKYRGLGIGSKVMKILIDKYDIAGTNLIGKTLFTESVMRSLVANGFEYAQPKFFVDPYYEEEREIYLSKEFRHKCHYYVYRTDGFHKKELTSDMPLISLKEILQKLDK
jgi:GNAT superfamily N-acetyltransferase|tara:strand:+ start:46 stop:672 length:627 start_codon:yes stop_codon:yes gene_type:complete